MAEIIMIETRQEFVSEFDGRRADAMQVTTTYRGGVTHTLRSDGRQIWFVRKEEQQPVFLWGLTAAEAQRQLGMSTMQTSKGEPSFSFQELERGTSVSITPEYLRDQSVGSSVVQNANAVAARAWAKAQDLALHLHGESLHAEAKQKQEEAAARAPLELAAKAQREAAKKEQSKQKAAATRAAKKAASS